MPSKKLHLLVTAGPTREMLDPVRFLSNVSTGLMGYQIARQAKRMNFQVTLVSGPTALRPPQGVRFVSVLSAEEMRRAVLTYWSQTDVLVMTAAVCDYTPVHFSKSKIKRIRQKTISFKRTPDILAQVGRRKGNRLMVGFALETEAVEKNAGAKLRRKNLDFIVANWYHKGNNPFGDQRAAVILMGKKGFKKVFPKMNKTQLAASLLRELKQRLDTKKG
ncbi:MAG: phosphopantothenoylcysteine decarboxylase [Candidatus Omnitrophica bacterium]|nr:phosphopantothenoylcysteine decarboxylase [Candidatus Omnitrophota bacterium]